MVHQVTLIEQELRGCFEVRCTCGDNVATFWGIDHATEIAQMHLWEVKGQGARFLPSGRNPAANLLPPGARKWKDHVKSR